MADDQSRRCNHLESCRPLAPILDNCEPDAPLDWIRPRQLAAIAVTVEYYRDEDNHHEHCQAGGVMRRCLDWPRRP